MLSDTMMLGGGRKAAYPIENSLLFRGSQYLTRTPAVKGDRKTFTFSCWFKRSALNVRQRLLFVGGVGDDSGLFNLEILNDKIQVSGGISSWRITSSVLRDVTAWYHVVLAVDTRFQIVDLYINGERVTAFETSNDIPVDLLTAVNSSNVIHYLGRTDSTTTGGGSLNFLQGYMAEPILVDGAALSPDHFGQIDPVTGSWRPKAVSGVDFGPNGFYLGKPWDPTDLGKDYSGVSGLTNIASRATGVSGTGSIGNNLSAAVDGNTSAASIYYINTVGGYAGLTFSSDQTFCKFSFYQVAYAGRINLFQLEKYDGTSWTKVPITGWENNASAYNTDEAQATNTNGWVTVSCAPVSCRGLRIKVVSLYANADSDTIISEIRLYSPTNDWTPVGFSASDVVGDSPTNVACVLNPLASPFISSTTASFADGNLVLTNGTGVGYAVAIGTLAIPNSGKWVFRVDKPVTPSGGGLTLANTYWFAGVVAISQVGRRPGVEGLMWTAETGYAGVSDNGCVCNFGTAVTGKPAVNVSATYELMVDFDEGIITIKKDGDTYYSGVLANPGEWVLPIVYIYNAATTTVHFVDFTASAADYKNICTANLPSTTGQTSGTFTGNANADGPCVFTGAVPETLSVNGNVVIWGTHADKLATGFKIRSASADYNASGANSWVATYDRKPTVGPKNRAPANAQGNP